MPDLSARVAEAFRSLPARYLGADPGFDATYHVRLGDIVLVPQDAIISTGLSVEDGIRIILSAGTAAPPRLPHEGDSGHGAAAT